MLVMGLVAALEWDILFPDARDYKNLTILPLKTRMLFGAKFSSLCLFVGLFALSMISVSIFIEPFIYLELYYRPHTLCVSGIFFSPFFQYFNHRYPYGFVGPPIVQPLFLPHKVFSSGCPCFLDRFVHETITVRDRMLCLG
jgi:hypothetical protein